jgi:hypothetical protein
MIDFYLTTADGAIENGPNDDHHIGSISLEQHQLLGQIWEACKPMGIKISYFEDNEIQPESAKILLEHLIKSQEKTQNTKTLSATKDLILIISRATVGGLGFHTYCD